MPFVKLDCNMLRSTLWYERLQREIFITALLMAEPIFTDKPMPQLNVRNLDETGWSVPPSGDRPYGFVAAAGVGIVRHAIVSNAESDIDEALSALEKLGEPEQSSRTPDFDGRRLVRVDGGYVILNYGKYRERDYTAAERQQRYRDKQKKTKTSKRNTVTSASNGVTSRNITHAEADAEADKKKGSANGSRPTVEDWLLKLEQNPTYKGINVRQLHGKLVTWCEIRGLKPTLRRLVTWLNKEDKPMPRHAARADYKRNYSPAPRQASDEEYENARRIAAEEKAKLKEALSQ